MEEEHRLKHQKDIEEELRANEEASRQAYMAKIKAE